MKHDLTYVSKSKPLFGIHKDLTLAERILTCWICGKQYVEIAAECGCSIEQAALYVDFIQRIIAMKAQAIVSYIEETYQIESTLMQLWPDMVKRGVSDKKALWLIDSGLGDRLWLICWHLTLMVITSMRMIKPCFYMLLLIVQL